MPQLMLRLVPGWDRTVIARKLAEAGASPEVIALVGKLLTDRESAAARAREKNCLRQRRFQERRRVRKPAMGLSPAEQAKWERDLRVREWIMDIQRKLAENQKIAQLVIETILPPQGVPGRT
jgi:hypothetical protein